VDKVSCNLKIIMTEEQQKTAEIAGQPDVISWVDFLQEHPPGSSVSVSGAVRSTAAQYTGTYYALIAPQLQLHCPEPTCNATMFFTSEGGGEKVSQKDYTKTFLTYWCRNCNKYSKMFSLAIRLVNDKVCVAYKFGELPHFGPPVPARVLRLIQSDRELFLSGRRCENQGLGIGAFTYYRRVVEKQWTRLVDEIIRVGGAIGVTEASIKALETARDEKQFSKAVKTLKDAIPSVLLINGQNPLLLLHGALSQGVHNLSDQDCLELATSIRVVLVEFAEKLGQALKDEKELSDAVTRLLKAQTQ
jgi:hypothetical protein